MEPAIEFIRKVADAQPTQISSICAESDSWQPPLQALICARWWSRVWIVQEVALADDVMVRSGRYEVAWETLAMFFRRLSTMQTHRLDYKVLDFVDTIAKVKQSAADPGNGLLDFALRFRNRVAGNPRDKLLGFSGLLHSTTLDIPVNPYRKSASEVFAHFAVSTINKTGSLAIMAFAENCAADYTGWAADWAQMTSEEWAEHDPLSLGQGSKQETLDKFGIGNLGPSISTITGRNYSAAQKLPAKCRVGPEWHSIYLTGWQVDKVKRSGDPFDDVRKTAKTIEGWEKLLNEPGINLRGNLCKRFKTTLVADAWQGDLPGNWLEQFQQLFVQGAAQSPGLGTADVTQEGHHVEAQMPPSASTPLPIQLAQLIKACCFNRKFFYTEKGRLGLGPARATHMGSLVCVFPGSDVPFILFPQLWGSGFYFAGQAFVEGIMDKESLQDTLTRNGTKLQEFLIR